MADHSRQCLEHSVSNNIDNNNRHFEVPFFPLFWQYQHFCSDNTSGTLKEIFELMKLSIISAHTYCRIQRLNIQPAVSDAYATLLQQAKETVKYQHIKTVLIGDGYLRHVLYFHLVTRDP